MTHTTSADAAPATRARSPLAWTTVVSVLTLLVAAATALLHLVGATVHTSYMNYWGLDAALFPKPADWTIILGYHGVVERSIYALGAVVSGVLWLLLAAVGFSGYVALLAGPSDMGIGRFLSAIDRLPVSMRGFVRRMVVPFYLVLMLPAVLFLMVVAMAAPLYIGDLAGKAQGQSEALDFKKGCAASRRLCIELRRDGKPTVTGYLLESSTTHIAVYDADAHRARALSRDGVETAGSPRLP